MTIENPVDNFECVNIDITDDLLMTAKIVAYMYDLQVKREDGQTKPYTPKAFPEKAIDIMIPIDDECIIEIFLDTKSKKWDSKFRWNGKICKLSPDQMGQFLKSEFYSKMIRSLEQKWPLTDKTYSDLFDAVLFKQMKIGFSESELEDSINEVDQPGKRKDLAGKDVTGDDERDYTNSGRKILHFSDHGVKSGSGMYYCWPDPKKEFKWSQWRDWKKIRPFCKMEFMYSGRKYMLALPLFNENFDNRGFRAADLMWEPPLGWLTPGECEDIMKLSIVRKFTRQCIKRITKFLKISDEELFEKINAPDKITIDDIRKTKRIIKSVLDSALKTNKADTFSWK